MRPLDEEFERRRRAFRLGIPEKSNMASTAATDGRLLIRAARQFVEIGADDEPRFSPLRDLRAESNRIARALRKRGVGRGDRVALLLPQSRHVAAAHIAIYKLGAVALPLAEPVRHRRAALPAGQFRGPRLDLRRLRTGEVREIDGRLPELRNRPLPRRRP